MIDARKDALIRVKASKLNALIARIILVISACGLLFWANFWADWRIVLGVFLMFVCQYLDDRIAELRLKEAELSDDD